MQRFTDPQYLTQNQYKDAGNLDARIAIHQRFSTNPQGWFNWIFDTLIKLPAESKILELGCGSAEMWKECISRIPAGWVITLTDLSNGMLDAAWRNLVPLGCNFKFEQMDAQSIPYGDKTFDAVIANHMLYHVPDRAKALAEIKRVLKPDGSLFATTVGENHMKEMDEWRRRADNTYAGSLAMPFTLENGMEQLTPFFSKVQLLRYEDSLHVTEIKPVIVYLCSVIGSSDLNTTELAKIQSELEARLEQEKSIFISKDSGLFEVLK